MMYFLMKKFTHLINCFTYLLYRPYLALVLLHYAFILHALFYAVFCASSSIFSTKFLKVLRQLIFPRKMMSSFLLVSLKYLLLDVPLKRHLFRSSSIFHLHDMAQPTQSMYVMVCVQLIQHIVISYPVFMKN